MKRMHNEMMMMQAMHCHINSMNASIILTEEVDLLEILAELGLLRWVDRGVPICDPVRLSPISSSALLFFCAMMSLGGRKTQGNIMKRMAD